MSCNCGTPWIVLLLFLIKSDSTLSKFQNSDNLKDIDQKLTHLDPVQRNELKQLTHEYEHLFPDTTTRTDKIYHEKKKFNSICWK